MISTVTLKDKNKVCGHQKNCLAEILTKKIIDYAKKQSKRTDTEKKKDFDRLNEEQEGWVKRRMAGSAWTWERWDEMIEEWTPWSSCGGADQCMEVL